MWIEQKPEKKYMNGNSVEVLLEALSFAGIKYTHSIPKICTNITTLFLSNRIICTSTTDWFYINVLFSEAV